MYKTLSGREPAAGLLENAKNIIDKMEQKPCLGIVLVGNNPASELYVKKKMQKAEKVGMKVNLKRLPLNVTQDELLSLVRVLNRDEDVDGFIVQSPLPKHIDYQAVVDGIDPKKDVDGWTSMNIGKMFLGMSDTFMPATPMGIMKLLDYYGVEISGKNATVIGRGNVVGKPMSFMLLQKNATVTICHSKTRDLAEHTKNADIIVCAAGHPGLLKADMVREGASIIDAGTTKIGEKTLGDVDFEDCIKKANCSPVPGGVGPMTVAMLISNCLEAAIRKRH